MLMDDKVTAMNVLVLKVQFFKVLNAVPRRVSSRTAAYRGEFLREVFRVVLNFYFASFNCGRGWTTIIAGIGMLS